MRRFGRVIRGQTPPKMKKPQQNASAGGQNYVRESRKWPKLTGNDRPGGACAAQSEDNMVNKVRVTIAGAPYAIATTDTENYITALAKKLDDDITKLLDGNANLSVTKAAVFCAMDYLDEYRKSAGSAENMRSQIQDYIADAAKAKLTSDKVKAENEVLKRENAALREQLAKLQK